MLRDTSNDIGSAVRELLPAADTRDRAAYLLALRLADAIDRSNDRMTLQFLAPTLLSTLAQLQATPKSRLVAKTNEQVSADEQPTQLSKLRATHRGNVSANRN
jgi:hypothetical protein